MEKLKNTDPGNAAKIQKSAREFEAVLLSHWLEQAEQSFASVPGSDQDPDADPGRDQFHAIAMQAVGSALTGGHGGSGNRDHGGQAPGGSGGPQGGQVNAIENKGLKDRSHFDQTLGYPKGDKVIIGLKFFLELPIKQLRGIAGDHL